MLQKKYDVAVLEALFNGIFKDSENTILISGGDEPIYLPAKEPGEFHKIVSTKDYFSSALHEISHWCVAGLKRRQCVDYGYWYVPDGRNKEQQSLFEQVEVKPQALEWIFTQASGRHFRPSVDNVNQPDLGASEEFLKNIHAQTLNYLADGLPERASLFLNSLLQYYQADRAFLIADEFRLEMLQ